MIITEDEKLTAKESFALFLKANKLRQTLERFRILEFVYSMDSLFSVDELHNLMCNNKLRVSLATIYNTLDLLQKSNLIIRHNFNNKTIKYEKTPSKSSNYYRICMQCGYVKEFTDKKLKKSISLRTFEAFSTLHHSLYFYGICKKCKTKKRK